MGLRTGTVTARCRVSMQFPVIKSKNLDVHCLQIVTGLVNPGRAKRERDLRCMATFYCSTRYKAVSTKYALSLLTPYKWSNLSSVTFESYFKLRSSPSLPLKCFSSLDGNESGTTFLGSLQDKFWSKKMTIPVNVNDNDGNNVRRLRPGKLLFRFFFLPRSPCSI